MKSCVLVIEKSIQERFKREKDLLKIMIYEEIDILKSSEGYTKEREVLLSDALYVIDRGFGDLMKGLNNSNAQDRLRKLECFKDSLLCVLFDE